MDKYKWMVIGVLLVTCFNHMTIGLRVDQRKSFRYCDEPQYGKVVRVDVLGSACQQWPCIMTPGKIGTFQLTLTHEMGFPIFYLKSDIFANARLKIGGMHRVGLDGETKKAVCPYTHPGCPFYSHSTIVITKVVKVPKEVRFVRSPMMVEFRITDGKDRTLTCFLAPVLVG